MTEVEQLREDYRKMEARRNSAEQALAMERSKVHELMQSVKYLREQFEVLRGQFHDYRAGHRDNE